MERIESLRSELNHSIVEIFESSIKRLCQLGMTNRATMLWLQDNHWLESLFASL
jgi:hypothetical protein